MPADYPTINKSMLVNDEVADQSTQLSPGEEALDGDSNAVVTVVRAAANPGINDKRQRGQLWYNTANDFLWSSSWTGTGNGTWVRVGTLTDVTAHAATHAPGGTDALPWSAIHGRGLLAARPAASAANTGYLYDATDNAILYRSSGTTWQAIGGTDLDNEYRHTQAVPATAWTVNHNLGRFPGSIGIRDTSNRLVGARVTHVTTNQLVIDFGIPVAGEASIR